MSRAGSVAAPLAAFVERNERALGLLVVLLSLLVQANAILHYGYIGQDFEDHVFKLNTVRGGDPLFVVGTQDAPLPYYLAAALCRLLPGRPVLEVFAFGTAIMNAVAVVLFHRLAGLLISRAALRLAATVLLAFVPFRLVHSVVFSGDSFTPLPFAAAVLLVAGLNAAQDGRAARVRILAVVTTLALLAKHSFVALVPALLVALLALFRSRRLDRRRAATFLVLVVLLPGLLGLLLFLGSSHGTVHPWKRVPGTGPAMTLDDLLLLKKRDAYLLSAPSYDDRDYQGKYNLVVPHRFSYPALLHLGVWTDLLNFFQYDPERPYIPRRAPADRWKMALSVKAGIPFSVAALLATLYYAARSLPRFVRALLRRAPLGDREFALFVAVVFALACHLVIVVNLPYLRWAYWSGYWLPRLVMPSILTFLLLAFAGLDEILDRLRPPVATALALVMLGWMVAQSALHASFLWPWGAYGPMPRIDLPGYH
jgi:hypothetical protein